MPTYTPCLKSVQGSVVVGEPVDIAALVRAQEGGLGGAGGAGTGGASGAGTGGAP